MNHHLEYFLQDCEERQQAKRERYEQKAEQLRAEATSLHDRAHEMAQAIPFGQPILVGPYSESSDRRYRAASMTLSASLSPQVKRLTTTNIRQKQWGLAVFPVMTPKLLTSSRQNCRNWKNFRR